MSNDMGALSQRATQLIDSISDAIMGAVQAGAERIQLATQVAMIEQRMSAFGAVLETIGTQKAALLARCESATGPMRALLLAQVDALSGQEMALLARIGVPTDAARLAVDLADQPAEATHRREGRAFRRVASANGHTTPAE